MGVETDRGGNTEDMVMFFLQSSLEFVGHAENGNLVEEFLSLALGDPEFPATTPEVFWILPYRTDAFAEDMD